MKLSREEEAMLVAVAQASERGIGLDEQLGHELDAQDHAALLTLVRLGLLEEDS